MNVKHHIEIASNLEYIRDICDVRYKLTIDNIMRQKGKKSKPM